MTLDEAIKHCEEIADNFDRTLARFDGDDVQKENTCACMNQHRQLAEWLKDYKRLRNKELAEQEKREAEEEARREAMRIDDNEDTLAYKGMRGEKV